MKQLNPDLYQRLLALSSSQRAAIENQLKTEAKETSSSNQLPQQLVAYVVPAGDVDASRLDTKALTNAVKAKLPTYMVPNVVVPLAKLPLNAKCKLHNCGLPAPPPALVRGDSKAAPTTRTEPTPPDIRCAVTRPESGGTDDNFFAMGGGSILRNQVVSRGRGASLQPAPPKLF